MLYPKTFISVLSIVVFSHGYLLSSTILERPKKLVQVKAKAIPLNLRNVNIIVKQQVVKKKEEPKKKIVKPKKKIKPKAKKKIIEKKVEVKATTKVEPEKKIVPIISKKLPIVPTKPELTIEEKKAIEDKYLLEIKKKLADNQVYPYKAKRLNHNGIVVIYFTIHKDGTIADIGIQKESKYKSLNKSALNILTKVGRFKPIPTKLKKGKINISIPIEYKIIR